MIQFHGNDWVAAKWDGRLSWIAEVKIANSIGMWGSTKRSLIHKKIQWICE
jgi:hypothetical protein